MTGTEPLPFPPPALANRVGALDADQPDEHFTAIGHLVKGRMLELLPPDWDFAGKRVLDFGCGAGRVLRCFAEEAGETKEFHGCDIDGPSIEWLQANLSPPFEVAVNGAAPPLPYADGHFDLIYGISVFTHLVETWSAWLLELRRVLADDGLLVLTVMGSARSEELAGETWNADRVGMHVVSHAQPWELGGPMVLHSEWWLREHWGRAFEIDRYAPVRPPDVNDWLLLRKKPGEPAPEDLEQPGTREPREAVALAHSLVRARGELTQLNAELADTRRELDRRERHLAAVEASRSWRMTRPLRRLAARLRRS